MSHRGAILALPGGMWAWTHGDENPFSAEAFEIIFAEAAGIELLIVGTGEDIAALPSDLRRRLREGGIVCEAMATGAAVRTYNVLFAENRAVAGAFVAVD
ncbi:MAG: Mth938-like domain-containing protein [Hyphomicrobiales bacterium]|nr:Mth938-like domain-containing protein [Hyphomicrobiales bacterium]